MNLGSMEPNQRLLRTPQGARPQSLSVRSDEDGITASTGTKQGTWVVVAMAALAIGGGLLVVGRYASHHSAQRLVSGDVACCNNLKQIGIALRMYAADNGGWFPPTLTALQEKYLVAPITYRCPVRGDHSSLFRTGEFTCDYRYHPGLRTDTPAPEKVCVVMNQVGNHREYGNALFVDGHVKGFSGKEWFVQFE